MLDTSRIRKGFILRVNNYMFANFKGLYMRLLFVYHFNYRHDTDTCQTPNSLESKVLTLHITTTSVTDLDSLTLLSCRTCSAVRPAIHI